MKKLLSILIISLTGLAFVPQTPTTITVAWDPQVGVDVFKVYQSFALSNPIANWTVITNLPGTNSSFSFQSMPIQSFYYITASNFWGECGPSNIVGTPPNPVVTNSVIRKGP